MPSPSRVSLLDLEPDLAASLPSRDLEDARAALSVQVALLRKGDWSPPEVRPGTLVALLVTDGYLLRVVEREGRRSTHLLGPGSSLDPWAAASGPLAPTRWTALSPVRFAVVTPTTLTDAARWPAILAALVRRFGTWTEHVCALATIQTLPTVEERIVGGLRLMADRWGERTDEGLVLKVPLTHAQLGELVGARRPTVTLGLAVLERQGQLLRKRREGAWVLDPQGVEEASPLSSATAS